VTDGGAVPDSTPQSTPDSTLALARTRDEATFFMDLHPCPRCGAHRTPWSCELLDRAG